MLFLRCAGGDGVYPKARIVLRLSLKLRIFDGLEWKTGCGASADNEFLTRVREHEAEVMRRVFGDADEAPSQPRAARHKLFSQKSDVQIVCDIVCLIINCSLLLHFLQRQRLALAAKVICLRYH